MASSLLSAELRGVSGVQKMIAKLEKQYPERVESVMLGIGERIRDDARRQLRSVGSGTISDSYSVNFSGSGKRRGETGPKSPTRYGVSKPRAFKGQKTYVVGSAHPLAHIFEFGTVTRRQSKTGRATGKITRRPALSPAYNSAIPKLKSELRKIPVMPKGL